MRPAVNTSRPYRKGFVQTHGGDYPYDHDRVSDSKYYSRNSDYQNGQNNPIHAAKGYHGTVRKPTYFLTGEAGPERVNITPLKHNKSTVNRSKPSKHFSVFSVGKKYKSIF